MNPQLLRLSEMAINGQILHKLDLIGSVTIENRSYFTVYRRYNNVHEMVVVDYHGDIYLQKDLSISESLSRILCIPKEKVAQARIQSLLSFKHHAEPPSGYYGFLEKTWSEIHETLFGVAVSLDGLFDVSESSSSDTTDSSSFSDSSSSSDLPPSSDPLSPSDPLSSSDPLSPLTTCNIGEEEVKYETNQMTETECQFSHFIIELKHPSSSSNPICEGVIKQEECLTKKDPIIVKQEEKITQELKEEKKRTSSSLSPPSSPRLTALSHQMILRNGRELRRKIS